ncbi:FAD-dependent oxidoreductase [Streptomyces scabiei]|uniref:FAD-dependent oxidoreductase n=1 Tax=Streptomyces scabiei TaxID=1930 RepID=UPI0038F7566A
MIAGGAECRRGAAVRCARQGRTAPAEPGEEKHAGPSWQPSVSWPTPDEPRRGRTCPPGPADRPLRRILGAYLSAEITARAAAHGIRFAQATGLATLTGDPVGGVALPDGTELTADLVATCAGAVPCAGWLAGTGLAGRLGVGIDDACATTVPGPFAAGDVTDSAATAHDPTGVRPSGPTPSPGPGPQRPRHLVFPRRNQHRTTVSGPRPPVSPSRSSAVCRSSANRPRCRAAWPSERARRFCARHGFADHATPAISPSLHCLRTGPTAPGEEGGRRDYVVHNLPSGCVNCQPTRGLVVCWPFAFVLVQLAAVKGASLESEGNPCQQDGKIMAENGLLSGGGRGDVWG